MPIIDQRGRVFALVHVVDLIVLSLGIGMSAVADAFFFSQSINRPLIAAVAVAGLVTLSLASSWYHGVPWKTVQAAIRDVKPSLLSPQRVRQRLTARRASDEVVIDLRETITVGPIIVVLERLLTEIVGFYHGSAVESVIIDICKRLRRTADQIGISRVISYFFSIPSPPETNHDE